MTGPIDSFQALAPVSPASPAAKPTAKDQQLWDASTQFENLFIQQLTQQLQDTVQPQDDSSGSADSSSDDPDDTTVGADDATTQYYAQLLPSALADGVSSAGGLGLAQQLYTAMQQQQAAK